MDPKTLTIDQVATMYSGAIMMNRRFFLVYLCFLTIVSVVSIVFCGATSFAENVWTLGVEDGKGFEFAQFSYEDYPRLFPNDATVSMSDEHPEKSFPFCLAGPMDIWGGAKAHTYTIEFDCPDVGNLDKYTNPEFEFVLKGLLHWGGLPLFQLDLNGNKQEIDVRLDGTPHATLYPETSKVNTLKAYFPKDAVKKTGNKLTITIARGAIVPLDCIEFNLKKGDFDGFRFRPVHGVLRGADGQAERVVRLDYDGETINAPLQLTIDATQKEGQKDRLLFHREGVALLPEVNPEGYTLVLPVSDSQNAFGEMNLSLHAEYKGQKRTFTTTLPKERPWTIRVIHQTHLDIGYTHPQEEVLALQVQALKDAVTYIKETKDYPEEARFKFHPEGMWAVEEFMKTATEQEKADFLEAVRSRDLHLDVLYAQAMTGMYNDEELFEVMQNAVRFSQKYGVTIDSAMQTDVPGYTWGLVPTLAQSGIKYLNIAPNPCHRIGHVFEWGEKPFYWESPSGKEKILCWIVSTSYNLFHWKPMGHQFTEDEIFSLVEQYKAKDFYDYDFIILRYCIEKDNGRPNRVVSDAVREWNEKYISPKLVMTTNSETLRFVEENYGEKLPVLRGDYTPYWEDGAASTSKATGVNRKSSEKILQAQTLWSMLDPKHYPRAAFDDAWTDLIMYDEHTWGAHNSISEPDNDFAIHQDRYKQNFAFHGAEKVAKLTDDALASVKKNDTISVDVFNTSSWNRSEYVFIDAEVAADNQSVVDADGNDVDSQKLKDGRLVFHANDVPPLGTKRFFMKKEAAVQKDSPLQVHTTREATFGNGRVTLKIDMTTGAVAELYCKGIDGNLVKTGDDGNRGLDDYLYIIGRDAEKNRARIEGNVTLTLVERGSCLMTLKIESPAPNCESLTRFVTIYKDSDQIDILNRLDKLMERKPEGTFFGFPLNVPGGVWRLNMPWVTIEVEKDQLPGGNRNFYPVERFANFSNDNYGVDLVNVEATMTQFAPILFTRPLSIEDWRTHIEPGNTIYSWVCNNHWETNYKADQSGVMEFRYVLRPHLGKYDPLASERFAREVHQPLIAVPVNPESKPVKSLLTLNNSAVIVSSIRPTEDGRGILLRLYNTSPGSQHAALTFMENSPYKSVFYSNPKEEKRESASGEISFAPHDILTFRLE